MGVGEGRVVGFGRWLAGGLGRCAAGAIGGRGCVGPAEWRGDGVCGGLGVALGWINVLGKVLWGLHRCFAGAVPANGGQNFGRGQEVAPDVRLVGLNGVILVSKTIVLEVKSTVVAMVDVITGRLVYVRLKVTSRRSHHSCTHHLDGSVKSRRPAASFRSLIHI